VDPRAGLDDVERRKIPCFYRELNSDPLVIESVASAIPALKTST
jgi:hypothetical protein